MRDEACVCVKLRLSCVRPTSCRNWVLCLLELLGTPRAGGQLFSLLSDQYTYLTRDSFWLARSEADAQPATRRRPLDPQIEPTPSPRRGGVWASALARDAAALGRRLPRARKARVEPGVELFEPVVPLPRFVVVRARVFFFRFVVVDSRQLIVPADEERTEELHRDAAELWEDYLRWSMALRQLRRAQGMLDFIRAQQNLQSRHVRPFRRRRHACNGRLDDEWRWSRKGAASRICK